METGEHWGPESQGWASGPWRAPRAAQVSSGTIPVVSSPCSRTQGSLLQRWRPEGRRVSKEHVLFTAASGRFGAHSRCYIFMWFSAIRLYMPYSLQSTSVYSPLISFDIGRGTNVDFL